MGEDGHGSPLAQRVPDTTGGSRWPTRAVQSTASAPLLGRWSEPEAVTEPIPAISPSASGYLATLAVTEIPALPRRAPEPDRIAEPDLAAEPGHAADSESAAQPDRAAGTLADREQVADTRAQAEPRAPRAPRQASRPSAPTIRYSRGAAVILSVLVLLIAVSLTYVAFRVIEKGGSEVSPQTLAAEAATRNLAAAWVADQVSQTAVVSCDPVMCQALKSHGFPAGQLLELGPGAPFPLGSAVVIETAAVRSQFGGRLGTAYAPAVLASFGSGIARTDIRVISPRGAAAYMSALSTDLLNRKASGAQLLHSPQINMTAAAARQLVTGQVDSRLLITIAAVAAEQPVAIVAFGDSGPGASAGLPLRSADLTEANGVAPTGTSAYVRSVLRLLSEQPSPYRAARVELVWSGRSQTVLRIEFAAPSPVGLLGPLAG
jgi:hypothetical protein